MKTDGARVLAEIFNRLSDTRVAFDKTKHAIRLTEWLIENAPGELRQVADLIQACLVASGPESVETVKSALFDSI